MEYFQVYDKEELNILKRQNSHYKSLSFSFSDTYLQNLKELLDEKNPYQLFVRDENGLFAGYIASAEIKSRPNFLWIVELFVAPEYQGKGIASELLKSAINEAKKKGLNGVITQTEFENIPAQNLYKKLGFVEINNPDWKKGITYVLQLSTNPLISIIIPVYNHAHTLKKTIEDIFRQTYRPLEVIVVNDGSTDDFETVADECIQFVQTHFIGMGSMLSVLSQENKGAPSARNLGFANSKGEYVIFWDADTLASPQMLEKLFTALQNNPDSAYAYSQFKFGWKVIKSQSFDADKLKQVNYIDTTSLIRRSALSLTSWDISLKRFQDWDLWLSLLEKNQTGVFVPEVLYKKIVEGRVGISNWIPSFIYKLPWKTKRVQKYEEAMNIVKKKHKLI